MSTVNPLRIIPIFVLEKSSADFHILKKSLHLALVSEYLLDYLLKIQQDTSMIIQCIAVKMSYYIPMNYITNDSQSYIPKYKHVK